MEISVNFSFRLTQSQDLSENPYFMNETHSLSYRMKNNISN